MGLSAEDRTEIDQLMARYNFAIDEGDADGVVSCFTADGEFFNKDETLARGHDGLRAYISTLGGRGQMRHVTTSALPEGDGDTATCRAYCTVLSTTPEDGHGIVAKGVYHDDLRRVDGRWQFSLRRFVGDG
jgi:ketosteroid isomerase-like protein